MCSKTITLILLISSSSLTLAEQFKECLLAPADTYVAIENDCRSYIYCGNSIEDSYKEECPRGTYFDETIAECVIDDNNICSRNAEDEEIVHESEYTETEEHNNTGEDITESGPEEIADNTVSEATTFVESNKINNNTSKPHCVRGEDGVYPHHERCEYYYKCISGYLTIFRCNFFYAWDYQKKICLPQHMAQCYDNSNIRIFM